MRLRASEALDGLPRIDHLSEVGSSDNLGLSSNFCLLAPSDVIMRYLPDGSVETQGLGVLDSKKKELVELVEVQSALDGVYSNSRILVPRTYADSVSLPLQHVVAQALIVIRWNASVASQVRSLSVDYAYGRVNGDEFWRSPKVIESIPDGQLCLIMNRRIGGWDGSPDSPVVELLGGGGHVKVVWDDELGDFRSHTVGETLVIEIEEELGFRAEPGRFHKVGGFVNSVTNELVVIAAIETTMNELGELQEAAYGNVGENVDGLYVAPFEDVIVDYLEDASAYAGGEESKPTNFPSNEPLMARIREVFQ